MNTKDSILKKIDLVMLTRNPIDKNHNICFQLHLTEKEMRLIKMRLNTKLTSLNKGNLKK